MLIPLILILCAGQVQGDSGDCVTKELLEKVGRHTNLTSFEGMYEVTYNDLSKKKSGREMHEYRFSAENTYESVCSMDGDSDGVVKATTQAFFQGQATYVHENRDRDGKVIDQVGVSPEYTAAMHGGWITFWGINPRRVMGDIGRAAGKDGLDIFGLSLTAFLLAPGPVQCFSRPPYLIIAHEAQVGRMRQSRDIWFDTTADMDVARIDTVVRPWECTPDELRKFYEGDLLDLRIVFASIEMFGYVDVGKGVRFPTSARVRTYEGDQSGNLSLREELAAKGYSPAESAVRFMQRANVALATDVKMTLIPESCTFNVPLPDGKFQLTYIDGAVIKKDAFDVTQSYVVKNKRWYQRTGLVVPLALLLASVPVLVFVGRRYLRWTW